MPEMIGLMAGLQDSTDMDKRRDYKWRPAQSFVVDFCASNWG